MAETKSLSSGGIFFDLILNHIKENVTKDVRYNCAECGRLKNKDGELSGTLCPSCESSNLSLDPVLNKFTTVVKNLQFDIENRLGHNKNTNTVFLKPSSKYNTGGVFSAKENIILPGRKWKDKPSLVNIGRSNNIAVQTDFSFSPFDDVSFVVQQKYSVSNRSHGLKRFEDENMSLNTNKHVKFSQKAESRYTCTPVRSEENIAESENSHPSSQNHHENQSGDNANLDNIDIIITKSQEHFIETETEMIESSVNDMLLPRKMNASPLLFSPETKDSEMNCSDDDTECVGATPPRENENICTWRKPGVKPNEEQQDQEMLDANDQEMNTNDAEDSKWNEGSEEQNEKLNQTFERTKIDSEDTNMEARNKKQNLMNKKYVRNIGDTERDKNWDGQDQKQNKVINEKLDSSNMEENCYLEPMQTYDNEIDKDQNEASVNKLREEPKDSNLTCTPLEDGTIGGDNLDNDDKEDSVSHLNNANDTDTIRNPISQMKMKDDEFEDNQIKDDEFKVDPAGKELTEDELLTQNSQKFSKHNLKIVISNVEGNDLDHLEKFIATFNPILDNDVSQSSNFLVVGVDSENRVMRRTPKFLKAICLHVCIVNVDYLVQCCQVGDIVHLEKKFIPYDSSGLNGPIRSCISPNASLLDNFVFFSLEKDDYLSSLLEFIIIHNGGILVPDIKLFKAYNRDIGTQREMGPPGEPRHIGTQQIMGPPAEPRHIGTQKNTCRGVEYKKILLYGDNEESTFTEACKLKVFTAYKCYSLNYKQLFDCVAIYDVAELGV
uniref:BRCT domain-containing protein n=1 Tax=Cacopsylla melanoneura TaxID=428564 RepID=A0A8D8LUL5_9HEMI